MRRFFLGSLVPSSECPAGFALSSLFGVTRRATSFVCNTGLVSQLFMALLAFSFIQLVGAELLFGWVLCQIYVSVSSTTAAVAAAAFRDRVPRSAERLRRHSGAKTFPKEVENGWREVIFLCTGPQDLGDLHQIQSAFTASCAAGCLHGVGRLLHKCFHIYKPFFVVRYDVLSHDKMLTTAL